MTETSGLGMVRASAYRWIPAVGIAYAAMASFANTPMVISRSILLALLAVASMLALPRGSLPPVRPALQAAALTLLALFALGILRVIVFRPVELGNITLITSVLGMTACWFLGTATAVLAPRPERVLLLFACVLPLVGVSLLLNAFLHGALPETNYWQFVAQAATGAEGVRTPFALSEDVLSLLVFYVGVTPFTLMVRQAWLRWAVLMGVGVALALLILNGSMTFVVAALVACLAVTVFGRKSLRREERRRAIMPFLVALLLGAGGAGYTVLVKPEYAAPVVSSIANKNVLQGNSLLDGRDEFWVGAAAHLGESPLIGFPLDEATTEETRFMYTNPHNDLLLAALKFGVPAALLLLFAVLRVAWEFAAGMRHPSNDVARAAATVGFAAWAALWLPPLYSGWLSSPFFSNLTLAGIAGLSYAVLRLHSPHRAATPSARSAPALISAPAASS